MGSIEIDSGLIGIDEHNVDKRWLKLYAEDFTNYNTWVAICDVLGIYPETSDTLTIVVHSAKGSDSGDT